ncbi:unnamed protein product [Anisakis simplex]|uniref:Protein SREK1IP1 n=1 Tax=Anisakis simplex TaxID=6269 RepID=A0A0M3K2M1_ANISI|nr:unnamed protein product [Anisakis simplex]
MANANFEPMPFIRKFGSDKLESVGTTSYGAATSSAVVLEESPFIELSGVTRMRVPVSGACRKCGYAGHLAFQCRNLIQPKNCADTFLDVSSTSSESDYETPLTAKGDAYC